MRKILFLGQKPVAEFAWDRLRRNEGSGYKLAAVCSNSQAETVWWHSNRIYALRGHVPFIDNSDRNEDLLVAAILKYSIDTIICMQHSWILSKEVLARVNYNALNFHNAKLPEYRGYNAVNHAVLNRDTQFTCTAHWMTDEVDRGEIALEAVFEIAPNDTAVSLYAKSHFASLRLFDQVLLLLANGRAVPRRPMVGEGRFYGRKSIEPLREIRDISGDEAELKARAFFFPPFEPAFLRRGAEKLYVLPGRLIRTGFAAGDFHAWQSLLEEVEREFSCELR